MASLDWSQCPAVESIPGKVSGAWVFKDTRMPVATVFENLEDMSIEEVMEQYDVTREQIEAVLEFVAESLAFRGHFRRRQRSAARQLRRSGDSIRFKSPRLCFVTGRFRNVGEPAICRTIAAPA